MLLLNSILHLKEIKMDHIISPKYCCSCLPSKSANTPKPTSSTILLPRISPENLICLPASAQGTVRQLPWRCLQQGLPCCTLHACSSPLGAQFKRSLLNLTHSAKNKQTNKKNRNVDHPFVSDLSALFTATPGTALACCEMQRDSAGCAQCARVEVGHTGSMGTCRRQH